MTAIRIVVANRASARLYECAAPGAPFALVEELLNAGLAHHERDLVSARAGRKRNPATGGPQALAPHGSARAHAVDEFGRTVADHIHERAASAGSSGLLLVAEPRMIGAIRAHLRSDVAERVVASVPMDLVHDTESALRKRLAPLVNRLAAGAEPRA